VQINARDLIVEVSDMAGSPVWTEIAGITEGGVDYAANEQAEDTTTFDDAGLYRQEIMQRGSKLTLKGRALQDSATGARDPGQAQVNTHALELGPDSQVDFRFRYPPATNWTTWTATVSRGEESGGNNAKVPFSFEMVRCGAAGTAVVV
jgi:hypothetical protein